MSAPGAAPPFAGAEGSGSGTPPPELFDLLEQRPEVLVAGAVATGVLSALILRWLSRGGRA